MAWDPGDQPPQEVFVGRTVGLPASGGEFVGVRINQSDFKVDSGQGCVVLYIRLPNNLVSYNFSGT